MEENTANTDTEQIQKRELEVDPCCSVDCENYMKLKQRLLKDKKCKTLDVVEVMFKGNRKHLFRNDQKFELSEYQEVVVSFEGGTDFGIVCNCCESSIKKLLENTEGEIENKILRPATDKDKTIQFDNQQDERKVISKSRELVKHHELDMKVTDAEWQFDRQRLTIYFTAPQRIDFRELVKDLARSFRTRIELRQISTREETKRLGNGVGACGQQLCCTTFLDDFGHVTLDHARKQQLSNNVAKLSGNCGRLKCCLLYEYEEYVEAFKKYPPLNSRVKLDEGMANIVKVDIFKDTIHLYVTNIGKHKYITYKELQTFANQNKVLPPDQSQPIKIDQLDEGEDLSHLEDDVVEDRTGRPNQKNQQKNNSENKKLSSYNRYGFDKNKGNSGGKNGGNGKNQKNKGNRNNPR